MYDIPVLVVSFFPLDSNRCIDIAVTTDVTGSYETIKQHTLDSTQQLVDVLNRGSVYHGYKHVQRQPSLCYRIVHSREFLEPLPLSPKVGRHGTPFPDYYAIMERVDIRHWVEERGVKEVWIWGYHGERMDLCESNMSGPWGDISNSDRDLTDLPVLSKTYTVYHYNYQRTVSEATEDHLHQIEAVLRHIDPELFWDRFVGGLNAGRCGWSHIPPNGLCDYDWANPRYVLTDIEDWRPEGGGEKNWINCQRWRADSLEWFIYWMQNIPGRENRLSFQGRKLSNWWQFIGDFDMAMGQRMTLLQPE